MLYSLEMNLYAWYSNFAISLSVVCFRSYEPFTLRWYWKLYSQLPSFSSVIVCAHQTHKSVRYTKWICALSKGEVR